MSLIFEKSYLWLIIAAIILTQIKIRISIFFNKKNINHEFGVILYLFSKYLPLKLELPVVKTIKGFIIPDFLIENEVEVAVPKKVLKKTSERISLDKINWQKLIIEIKRLQKLMRVYQPTVNCFIRSLRCEHLIWTTEYGAEDAATTGFNLGLIWWIKTTALAAFHRKIFFKKYTPQIQVIPRFNYSCLNIEFHCIFAIKLGHIIIVWMKAVKQYLKKGVNI